MRHLAMAILVGLAACASRDDTPVWTPSEPVPATTAVPFRAVEKTVTSSPVNTKSRIRRDETPPPEPSVKSKEPLSAPQRRALESERQALNTEIRTLQRRQHFDVDREVGRRHPRAYDARRLRSLKARQRNVLRRLRGD